MLQKAKFLLQDKTNRLILAGLILSVVIVIVTGTSTAPKPGHEDAGAEPFTADTIIPKGYVLVPLEIQNIDSLSSMIGQFGIVDLFTTPSPHQKSGQRVGRRLKLLRAPLNPQQFAVLVPENEATDILQASGPFTAVIQNPSDSGKSEVIAKVQNDSHQNRVEYYKGVRK